MNLRVVVDSNVYVSAFVFGGVPRTVLSAAEFGEFELFLSPTICREVERTLSQKFEWEHTRIELACRPLWTIATMAEPQQTVRIADDQDDDRILECAVAAKSQVIVTGDDDLLRLKSFERIRILTPRAFLNLIRRPL